MVANVTPLKAWGIKYYEDTAAAAGRAARDTRYGNGGLGEYYSERDTRQPVWLVSGDRQRVAELTGLSPEQCAGGDADSAAVTRWFNDGIAPNGAHGRAFRATDNHGFDVTFSVPKSVSLLRAFGNDVTQKAVEDAANRAVEEAMAYLSDHVGYTRVHNPTTGEKDLQKLPGLVSVVYQHETSRAGDPQLHFHVTVPNKQAREDGMLVSIDSKSLHHEAKAAANIFHATYRRELDRSMGAQFADVDPHRGVSDLVGVDRATIEAYSQRSAQIHDWARHNLEISDPDAGPTWDQLNAAAIATRPNKPEHKSWAQLQHDWHHDGPSFTIDMAAQKQTRQQRRANGVRVMDAARAALATIDKSAFTRADAIERVVAALPTDLGDDDGSMTPRRAAEVLVDHLLLPLTGPREAHHREGTARYTVTPVIEEERAILDMMVARDERSALSSSSVDVDSLSADQARAITNIATSPFLIQPLSAPAGAGKTTSLKALRAAAHRSPGDRRVIVLAPTGKAVDALPARAPATSRTPSPRHSKRCGRVRSPSMRAPQSSLTRRAWSALPSCASYLPLPLPAAPKRCLWATPTNSPRSNPVAACLNNSSRICPGRRTSQRCGVCAIPKSAVPPSRCAQVVRHRCAARSSGTAKATAYALGMLSPWQLMRSRPTTPIALKASTLFSSPTRGTCAMPSTLASITTRSPPMRQRWRRHAATASPPAMSSSAAATTPP